MLLHQKEIMMVHKVLYLTWKCCYFNWLVYLHYLLNKGYILHLLGLFYKNSGKIFILLWCLSSSETLYQMTFLASAQWQDFTVKLHVLKNLWMIIKISVLYCKYVSLCFTSQILLFCSYATCLSKAVTGSGKSGQSEKIREFKTLSGKIRENAG